MILTGHVACMGEIINAYNIFDGRPDGKRILEIPNSTFWDHFRIEHCYTNKILYCVLN
jgi:hypothetical protein